jgi:hypothetical protein
LTFWIHNRCSYEISDFYPESFLVIPFIISTSLHSHRINFIFYWDIIDSKSNPASFNSATKGSSNSTSFY